MTKKKDKIIPIKVWLDEESCWNNEPQYSEGYVEYVREDYHAQAMLHVLHNGVKQGKKEMLDKVCKWIDEHLYDRKYEIRDNEGIWVDTDVLLEDLKKAMEDAK